MKRRMLTIMTALCMTAAPVCGAVSEVMRTAVTTHAMESGTCGDNLRWTLDGARTLTISGTGDMKESPFSSDVKDKIKKVVIQSGVTSIGDFAFYECMSLTSVTILNPKCEISDHMGTFCNSINNNNYYFTGTIYGYPGSTAQTYAEKYKCTFVSLDTAPTTPTEPAPQAEPYSTGDVTGDSTINAKDASAVLIAAAKLGTGKKSGLSYEAGKAADVNNDGTINAKDANSILRYAAAVGTGKAPKITDYI